MERSSPYTLPIFLGLLGAAMLAGLIWLAQLAPLRGPPLLEFIPRYLALFAVYLGAVWGALQHRNGEGRARRKYGLVILIVAFGLTFRLPLLSNPPTLSDDVYRYLWDGSVIQQGINPYAYEVQSPELAGLNDGLRARVNNPQMASPYLPTAQVVFYTLANLAPTTPATYQVAMVAADLISMGVLLMILRRLNLPWAWSLIYFWNPLVVVEFSHGAHIDALMNVLMLAGLGLALKPGRSLGSPVLMAAATLVKPLPLLLAPMLAPRWRLRGTLVYVGALMAGLLPFSGAGWGIGSEAGTGIFGATRLYARYWNFNSGLYHWLEGLLTGTSSPGAVNPTLPGVAAAKLIVLAALAAVVLWCAWRSWRLEIEFEGGQIVNQLFAALWIVPVGGYLLLTTTVHPWYLTTLLVLVPFWVQGRWKGLRLAPWLYFSAAVVLSYLTYLDPANLRESNFTRRWEYFPLLILLAISALIPWLGDGDGIESN